MKTDRDRVQALLLLAIAVLLAMGLWFGVSAVAPQISEEWHLDAGTTAWLTLSVQLGFVAGTLLSALLNLSDVIRARHLFAACAFLGAATNAILAWRVHTPGPAIALRFLTGAFLAGVYPPGMKLVATWYREGRGFALGVVVGALTLGKASPYLVNALGSPSWRVNVGLASLIAAAGGLCVVLFVREGPFALPNQPFDLSQIAQVVRNRGVRLANFGYFGHMWELYAMWTWAPVMIRASLAATGDPPLYAEPADPPADRGGNLGRDGRRRLGAVLSLCDRARRPALHRDGVDDADLHRIPHHHGFDPHDAIARRPRRMALCIRRPRRRSVAGDHRHAAPARHPGGGKDRSGTAIVVSGLFDIQHSLPFRT